jgi:hypothetical protein
MRNVTQTALLRQSFNHKHLGAWLPQVAIKFSFSFGSQYWEAEATMYCGYDDQAPGDRCSEKTQ